MLNKNNSKVIVDNILIVLSFITLSIVSFSVLMHTKYIYGGWDIHFHVSRAFELYQSLKHGVIFPLSDFNYFHGNLTMVMYPYLNLYPLTLLFRLFRSYRSAIYVWFMFNTFVSLMISYYSSYLTYHSRGMSYLFATLYSLSGYLFAINTSYMDWGLASAYIYLPLVLFGYINFLLNQDKWLELSTGVSLLILSHVLSTLIILGFLLILSLLNVSRLIKYKWENIVKPVALTTCMTSIYWMPFIYLEVLNRGNISSPLPSVLNGYNSQSVLSAFKLQPQMGLDILAWLTVVLALFYFHRFRRIIKQLYIIAVLILISCSDLIPWPKISRLFPKIELIQKVYRFYIIPQVVLLLILSLIVVKYIKWRKVLVLLLVCFAIFVQVRNQVQFANSRRNEPILTNNYIAHHRYDLMSIPQNFKLGDNNSFKLLSNWLNSKDDYFPKALRGTPLNNLHNNLVVGSNQTTTLKSIGFNHFEFKLNKADRNVRLPMTVFRGQRVNVLMNNQRYPMQFVHNQMIIRDVQAGKYDVKISMYKNLGIMLSVIALSVVGILMYAKEWLVQIMQLRLKRKGKPDLIK